MAEQKVGIVIHYWGKIGVAGIEITDGELAVGDAIHIVGHTSDFSATIKSMRIEEGEIEVARVGDKVGVKIAEPAREHDDVFKVVQD